MDEDKRVDPPVKDFESEKDDQPYASSDEEEEEVVPAPALKMTSR
jgi:hypothetical protein